MKNYKTQSLDGLTVSLDKLTYEYNQEDLPPTTPHAFFYYLTISNLSDRTITLLGRKWILQSLSQYIIIEGEKIVGQTPTLEPGEIFSYNSYHLASENTKAMGAFYGVDLLNQVIHVRIPEFDMIIPQQKKANNRNEVRRSQ